MDSELSPYIPLLTLVIDSFPPNQIDDSLEFILDTDGNLDRCGWDPQLGSDLVYHPPRIRASSIHFVDERDSWDIVPPHLSVNRDCLALDWRSKQGDRWMGRRGPYLDASNSAQNQNRTVQDT